MPNLNVASQNRLTSWRTKLVAPSVPPNRREVHAIQKAQTMHEDCSQSESSLRDIPTTHLRNPAAQRERVRRQVHQQRSMCVPQKPSQAVFGTSCAAPASVERITKNRVGAQVSLRHPLTPLTALFRRDGYLWSCGRSLLPIILGVVNAWDCT